MSVTTQPTPKVHERRGGKLTVAAAALSAAMLTGSWFVDMGGPFSQERWRWMTGAALVSIVLTGVGIVFGRHHMRAIFRAPLTGLFYGLVAVIVLGGILAAVEWFLTPRTPVASLGAAALVGLPAGAVIGVGIGLIGWTVFRLIPARAPGTDAQRKRPRLQFSLRTMLFGVLVVALLLWIGMPAQRSYQRQRAVSQLLERGARLDFEREKADDWLGPLVGDRLGPQWYADVRAVEVGPSATDEDLRLLEYIGELRGVMLQCPEVTDAGMAHLTRLRAMELLYLECPQVTSEGFGAVTRLPKLNSLHIEGSFVSDAAVAQLMSPPKLRDLWLRNVTITGDGLSQLPPSPVRILAFYSVNVTDADLQYLAALPAVEYLTLSGTNVTDAGLAHLAQSRTLSHLGLGGAGFTGKALAQLSDIPNLTSLGLEAMFIQDKDLSALTALTRLQAISLHRTLITDAGLGYLEALPALRHVSLYGTWATKAGADELRAVLQAKQPPGAVDGP